MIVLWLYNNCVVVVLRFDCSVGMLCCTYAVAVLSDICVVNVMLECYDCIIVVFLLYCKRGLAFADMLRPYSGYIVAVLW